MLHTETDDLRAVITSPLAHQPPNGRGQVRRQNDHFGIG